MGVHLVRCLCCEGIGDEIVEDQSPTVIPTMGRRRPGRRCVERCRRSTGAQVQAGIVGSSQTNSRITTTVWSRR